MDEMIQYMLTIMPSVASIICMVLVTLLGNKKIAGGVINALNIIKSMKRTNDDQKDEIHELVGQNKELLKIIEDYENRFNKIENKLGDMVDELQKRLYEETKEKDLDTKDN